MVVDIINFYFIGFKCYTRNMSRFVYNIDDTAQRNQSLLCVGIDPWRSSLPIQDLSAFVVSIVEATSDLVCAFKPNIAFFEAEGAIGLQALKDVISAAKGFNIPVILDAKRADIGSSSTAYAKAIFEYWEADATTVSPYQGSDSIEPFLNYSEKGVFVLCKTSNPGSNDFQSLITSNGMAVYEHVAYKSKEWNAQGNVGLVVGATYPDEIVRIRSICPEMPLLIPGLGTQGGELKSTVEASLNSEGFGSIFNVSRSIIYAGKGTDYIAQIRHSALSMKTLINDVRTSMGHKW